MPRTPDPPSDVLTDANTFAVIHSWPTGHIEPRLIRWLMTGPAKLSWQSMAWSNVRFIPRAYNQGVKQALASGKANLLFVDHDIIPVAPTGNRPGTDPFLKPCEADIVCCPCNLGVPGAWADDRTFHCGLWRATREALLTLDALDGPNFLEEYTADGTELERCVCAYFAQRARKAGLRIVRQGWADHNVKHPQNGADGTV